MALDALRRDGEVRIAPAALPEPAEGPPGPDQ
jgi:hypothetical protein